MCLNDGRQSVCEMGTRRSVCDFLDEADLQNYSEDFKKLGVKSSKDLEYVDEEDLTEIGLPKLQRKKFQKAMKSKIAGSKNVED